MGGGGEGAGDRGTTQTAGHRLSLFLGPWGKTWELEEEGRADGVAKDEEPQTKGRGVVREERFCRTLAGLGMLRVSTEAWVNHLQA